MNKHRITHNFGEYYYQVLYLFRKWVEKKEELSHESLNNTLGNTKSGLTNHESLVVNEG